MNIGSCVRLAPVACGIALLIPMRVFAGDSDCDGQWQSLNAIFSGRVQVGAIYESGGVESLYVGGSFQMNDGQPMSRIARWDGQSWHEVGGGLNGTVFALHVHEDSNGRNLYVGGEFTLAGGAEIGYIARWDGHTWNSLGLGTSGPVYALTTIEGESGPVLLASGSFLQAGGAPYRYLATWDGAVWNSFGPGGMNATARVFTRFDDGTGDALYIAGDFTTFGGQTVNRIVRFEDDGSWSVLSGPVSVGMNSRIQGLVAFDDGSGPALYAAGQFTLAGGQTANRLAKWTGSGWEAWGTGANQRVHTMRIFNDGSGPAIFIGGNFNVVDGQFVPYVGKWDGTAWTSPDGGMNNFVMDLLPTEIDGLPALYAFGDFTQAGTVSVGGAAVLAGCDSTAPCPADLNGDGFINLPDLNLVLSNFGQSSAVGDVNGDGVVNLSDLNAILSAFGTACP